MRSRTDPRSSIRAMRNVRRRQRDAEATRDAPQPRGGIGCDTGERQCVRVGVEQRCQTAIRAADAEPCVVPRVMAPDGPVGVRVDRNGAEPLSESIRRGIGVLERRRVERDAPKLFRYAAALRHLHVDAGTAEAADARIERRRDHSHGDARVARNVARAERHSVERIVHLAWQAERRQPAIGRERDAWRVQGERVEIAGKLRRQRAVDAQGVVVGRRGIAQLAAIRERPRPRRGHAHGGELRGFALQPNVDDDLRGRTNRHAAAKGTVAWRRRVHEIVARALLEANRKPSRRVGDRLLERAIRRHGGDDGHRRHRAAAVGRDGTSNDFRSSGQRRCLCERGFSEQARTGDCDNRATGHCASDVQFEFAHARKCPASLGLARGHHLIPEK